MLKFNLTIENNLHNYIVTGKVWTCNMHNYLIWHRQLCFASTHPMPLCILWFINNFTVLFKVGINMYLIQLQIFVSVSINYEWFDIPCYFTLCFKPGVYWLSAWLLKITTVCVCVPVPNAFTWYWICTKSWASLIYFKM